MGNGPRARDRLTAAVRGSRARIRVLERDFSSAGGPCCGSVGPPAAACPAGPVVPWPVPVSGLELPGPARHGYDAESAAPPSAGSHLPAGARGSVAAPSPGSGSESGPEGRGRPEAQVPPGLVRFQGPCTAGWLREPRESFGSSSSSPPLSSSCVERRHASLVSFYQMTIRPALASLRDQSLWRPERSLTGMSPTRYLFATTRDRPFEWRLTREAFPWVQAE